ncbi:MAG TPA: hypothetical protein PKL83_05160 [bacterium]|nr:hypothetical protein [bacterium]
MANIWCQNCVHCQEGNNPKYPNYHWYCDLDGYGEVWNKACKDDKEGKFYKEQMKRYGNKFYIDDGYLYFCAEIDYDLPYRVNDAEDDRPCVVFLKAIYGDDYDGYDS